MIWLVWLVWLVWLIWLENTKINTYVLMFLLTISTTAVAYVVSVEASQLEPHCEEMSPPLMVLVVLIVVMLGIIVMENTRWYG